MTYRVVSLFLLGFIAFYTARATWRVRVERVPVPVAAPLVVYPTPVTPVPMRIGDVQVVELAAAEVRAAFDDLPGVSRNIRIVPAIRDGLPAGFKLYAIRPDSLAARAGLQNGDTLLTVDGQALTSPDSALEAYARLRQSPASVTLGLRRRGQPMTLVVVLRDRPA